MAVDFSRRVNTDLNTTPFQYVVFGKDGGLLEVELNEAQMLAYERQRNTLKLLGNLYSNPFMFKYDSENSVLSIEPGILSIDGYLIKITDNVSIPNVTEGSGVFVTISTETVDKDSTLKKFGISSEENIENTIKDDRIGIETSRRESISVTIGTTSEDNSVFLGEVSGSEFIVYSEFKNIPKGFREFGSLLTPVIALTEADFESKNLIDIVTDYHSTCNSEKVVFLIKPSEMGKSISNDFPVKIRWSYSDLKYYAILESELVMNGIYGKNTFKKSPYGGKLKWNLSYMRNDSTNSNFYDSPEWNYFGAANNQKLYSRWSKEYMVEVTGADGRFRIDCPYSKEGIIRKPNVNGWVPEIVAKDLLSFRRVEVDYTELLAGDSSSLVKPKIQDDGTAEPSFITWCVSLACGYIEADPSWVTVKSTQSKTYDFTINFNQADSEEHIIDLGCNTFTTGNSILSGTVSFILDEDGEYILEHGYYRVTYSNLKISTKDGTSCFDLIYNSTDVTYKVDNTNSKIEEINSNLGASNAGAHNSVYRGKYLGNALTTEQKAQISAGTFNDLYIGDYWTIDGVNYRIAAFDYWLNSGDTTCTTHHVVIVPDTCLYCAKMNTSNITTGAYVGSAMYTSNLEQAKTIINNAFGSANILSHREYLANATKSTTDPTYESAGYWYDSTVELMNERMIYGADVFHNIEVNGAIPLNYTIDKSQLPLFALEPSRICNCDTWWLRDVVSAEYFATVGCFSGADGNNASSSFGVRPAFAIKG